jgi:hypothetical protein
MSNVPPPGDPNQPGYQPPPAAYGAPAGGAAPVPTADSGGLLSPTWMMSDPAPAGWTQKQKVVAGILGILLNGLGAHSFYLGNTKKGIIQIVVTIVTCGLGGLWGLIEGIMILTGSIKTDAYGLPLVD